ncbi:MAG: MFS transporter [Alphaproteobacteria bacterium]|nr:MFS transporter [Alphaproteobacteria bacterium]
MIKNTLKTFKAIPASIWAIGLAGFLLNISSVIVFGLCALYMKSSLATTLTVIALLEASVEVLSNVTKLFSGVLSDYLMRRKVLMLVGFAMITIARPILAIFPSIEAIFTARFLDRLGNGVQSAPRDALVGDLAPDALKGACFGLRQAWSQAGSCVGGGVSWWLMINSNDNYTYAFWMATIPALIGMFILWFFVHESSKTKDMPQASRTNKHPIQMKDFLRLGAFFWGLMFIVFVFFLARISESFLLLHAKETFLYTAAQTQFILMFYNGFNAVISYPVGSISDRVPRINVLLFGIFTLIAADFCLATAQSSALMLVGVSLWGIQVGITHSMFIAIITDRIPFDLRGTGIGAFYLIMAAALFVGGKIAGTVSEMFSFREAFMTSGFIAVCAMILLFVFARWHREKGNTHQQA